MMVGRWLGISIIALGSLSTCLAVSSHDLAKHAEDANQKIQITESFNHSDYLYRSAIRISVYEGEATLSGKVENAVDRDLAKQLALGVAGIDVVDNRLVVEPGFLSALAPSRRTYSQMVAQAQYNAAGIARGRAESAISAEVQDQWSFSDSWISVKVKFAFLWADNIDSENILVDSRNGIVILRGQVTDGAGHALAMERARNIRGVKGINASDFSHTSMAETSIH